MFKKKTPSQAEEVKSIVQENSPYTSFTLSYEDNQSITIIYIKEVCDSQKLHDLIITPFYELNGDIQTYKSYVHSQPEVEEYKSLDETIDGLTKGQIVVIIADEVKLFDLKDHKNTAIQDASVETTIQGPQTGISEDIATNLNLIRHRYHQPTLRSEISTIGKKTKNQYALIYDEKEVNPNILKEFKKKLEEIDADVIQSVGEVERKFHKRKNLIPTLIVTERPDRITLNIAEGKVIFMMEGSPFALIAPTIFYDFMSSMEDKYQPYWVSKFLIALRYIGLFISIILPAAYVGVTAYNPELLRVQLALSIAGSRTPVPYPAYLEVLFMLLMMELLTEASIRLPKQIGSTATTVGGLILGQAATEAGLVSNIMIIIVAAVAISNFVIPINEMSFSMRVIKYIFLVITTLTGLIGLVVSFIALIYYFVSLDSFGEPFLRITSKDKKGVSTSE